MGACAAYVGNVGAGGWVRARREAHWQLRRGRIRARRAVLAEIEGRAMMGGLGR
jgi:hypothetical protein